MLKLTRFASVKSWGARIITNGNVASYFSLWPLSASITGTTLYFVKFPIRWAIGPSKEQNATQFWDKIVFWKSWSRTIEQVAIKYEYYSLRASKPHQGWLAGNWLSKGHIPRDQLQAPRKLTDNNLGSHIQQTENKIIKNYDSQQDTSR